MPGTILGTCSVASVMSDSVTPWTVACQASLSMGFPSKNTGVGSISSRRGASRPGDQTRVSVSPALQADSL